MLREAKIKERIGVPGYEALAGVMDFLQSSAEEAEARVVRGTSWFVTAAVAERCSVSARIRAVESG